MPTRCSTLDGCIYGLRCRFLLDPAGQRFRDKKQKRRKKRSRVDMIGVAATISQGNGKHSGRWVAVEGGGEVAVLGVKD